MGHSQATHSSRRAVPTAPPQFGNHRTHSSSRRHAQGTTNHNPQTEAASGGESRTLFPPQRLLSHGTQRAGRKLTHSCVSAATNALWLRRQDLPARLRHAWLCNLPGDMVTGSIPCQAGGKPLSWIRSSDEGCNTEWDSPPPAQDTNVGAPPRGANPATTSWITSAGMLAFATRGCTPEDMTSSGIISPKSPARRDLLRRSSKKCSSPGQAQDHRTHGFGNLDRCPHLHSPCRPTHRPGTSQRRTSEAQSLWTAWLRREQTGARNDSCGPGAAWQNPAILDADDAHSVATPHWDSPNTSQSSEDTPRARPHSARPTSYDEIPWARPDTEQMSSPGETSA